MKSGKFFFILIWLLFIKVKLIFGSIFFLFVIKLVFSRIFVLLLKIILEVESLNVLFVILLLFLNFKLKVEFGCLLFFFIFCNVFLNVGDFLCLFFII